MRKRVLGTTAALGLFTTVEKGLAAARHVLLAALFGAGAAMDSLVVGLSVAEVILALLTGSFLVVLIPLHASWKEAAGIAVADARARNVAIWVLAILALAAVLVALAGGRLAAWIGFGLPAPQRSGMGPFMPWLALFLWGTGAGVVATAFYHLRGRFLAPQMAQVVERVVALIVLFTLAPALGLVAWPAALAAGGLALAAVLVAGAPRSGPRPALRLSLQAPEMKAFTLLALPLLAAALVDQAVVITDRTMASTLPAGGISALYFAMVLWRLPVVLLCTNFCTVLFPRLSADMAARDPEKIRDSVGFGLKSMVLLMLAATVILMICSRDLTALLFERGAFGAASTDLTARTLLALSLCLVAQGIGSVINLALFAVRRTGVVAAAGSVRVGLNIGLNALLIGPLGVVGIALSTSLTLTLWLVLIAIPFTREMRRLGAGPVWGRPFAALAWKAGAAALLMAAVSSWLVGASLLAGETQMAQLLRLVVTATAGVVVYAGTLYLFRLPEAAAAARLLGGRLGWRPSS